ncbi:MAG: hypothetical protein ACYC67_24515 [Prosthecobacter sp.]
MDEELDKNLFSALRQDVTSLIPTLAPQDGDKLSAQLAKLLAMMNGGPNDTTAKSTALEASRVLKGAAGKLHSISVFNSKASAQFILIMDAAAVPADGAVTLLEVPIAIAAGATVKIDYPRPLIASAGICVSNSSTGSFTKTIGSADCVFRAQVTD